MPFSINEKIILIFLFLNTYVISALPLFYTLHGLVIYFQAILFFIFLIINFESIISYKFNFSLKRLTIVTILSILAIIFLIYSTFFINYQFLSIKVFFKTLSYFILMFFFFFYFPKYFYKDLNKFETFLNFILYFVIINSILGLFLRFIGFNLNLSYPFHFLGLFNHPNTVAFTFSFAIPILFYKYFTNQININKFISFLIILSIALLLTLSRAGYIGITISVLFIIYKKSKNLFVISIILILLLFVLVISELLLFKGNSTLFRALLMYTAYEMIIADQISFLWGYGVYNSIDVFKDEKIIFGNYERVPDPHNVFLLLGIQFGMIITLLVSLIFIIILVKSYLSLKKQTYTTQENQIIILSISICLGLFFQNQLEDIIVYPEYFVMPLFLIFLGLLYRFNNYSKLKEI